MSRKSTLRDRIAQFTDAMAKQLPRETGATLAAELEKLAESGIAAGALQRGATAPDFELPNAQGGTFELSTALSKGPVVLSFYRGSWCPFCDLQLRAYQDVLPDIRGLGADLVAVSPQLPDHALVDIKEKKLTFPVLTDAHNAVARKYGLVFGLSDAMKGLQETFGNPLPRFNGDDSWELPMPGTFVIGRDGVVQLAHVDPNYMRRLEPAAILEALQALNG
ncbi:MAG: peroxiredoxin-like family protein [Myxococcales bacterium]